MAELSEDEKQSLDDEPPKTLTAHSATGCNGIFYNSCEQLHSPQVWNVSRTRA